MDGGQSALGISRQLEFGPAGCVLISKYASARTLAILPMLNMGLSQPVRDHRIESVSNALSWLLRRSICGVEHAYTMLAIALKAERPLLATASHPSNGRKWWLADVIE